MSQHSGRLILGDSPETSEVEGADLCGMLDNDQAGESRALGDILQAVEAFNLYRR